MTLVLLALAGGLGAVARFVVDAVAARHNPLRMPLGTLVVNVTGSLLLGMLAGWVAFSDAGVLAADVRAVLGTGFCGGYTTFSTASVETVRLCLAEDVPRGAGYAALTLVAAVFAAALGFGAAALLA